MSYGISFAEISTRQELAAFLHLSEKRLTYLLYKMPSDIKYRRVELRKKSGGVRVVHAPCRLLKSCQRLLADAMLSAYEGKPCVHGYAKGKSIITNARIHRHKRWVVNLDLRDFFPSVHFGRVRGLFMGASFGFNEAVATMLARLTCHEGILPQGAPSSPVISNYICRGLDGRLSAFARTAKLCYSRYADDIAFSTNLASLPGGLGTIDDTGRLALNPEFVKMVEGEGFLINGDKTRYSTRFNRQSVTGLTVNEKVNVSRRYIRNIRAMLHSWETLGLDGAARLFHDKYDSGREAGTGRMDLRFKRAVTGKLGFILQVKGADSSVVKTLYGRLRKLDKAFIPPIPDIFVADSSVPVVFCEGKTDGVHLETALRHLQRKGLFTDLEVTFYHYDDDTCAVNNDLLMQKCRTAHIDPTGILRIFLFDRDVKSINREAEADGAGFRRWDSNIYSCLLPVPAHRNFEEICIEHFYTDEVIMSADRNGRRLYLSTEFDPATSRHLDADLTYMRRNYLNAPYPRILCDGVLNGDGKNVALSKVDFARSIKGGNGRFSEVSFDAFIPVFELLRKVIDDNTRRVD